MRVYALPWQTHLSTGANAQSPEQDHPGVAQAARPRPWH